MMIAPRGNRNVIHVTHVTTGTTAAERMPATSIDAEIPSHGTVKHVKPAAPTNGDTVMNRTTIMIEIMTEKTTTATVK